MRELLSIEQYAAELAELVELGSQTQRLPLNAARGGTLAEAALAPVAVPAFTNSAMDGYAVRFTEARDPESELRVIGDVAAGSSLNPAAGPGECVRIMTGAALPDFADTVIPIEDTDAGPSRVRVLQPPASRGQHVRASGEDFAAGAMLAAPGTLLTPARLASLAAVGMTELLVRRPPVVAVCATGDELISDGRPLARGQIYESNSIGLAASLERDGATVLRGGPLPDRPESLRGWLDSTEADLVVLTGGASVGAFDVVRDVLSEAGGQFRHVRMQPGKPQGWCRWGRTPVVSLPGNPLSAMLSYETFVRPLLDRMLGRSGPNWLRGIAAADWASPAGRAQLVPVQVSSTAAGQLSLRPAHRRGSASHLVTSLAEADGYCVVAPAVERVGVGDVLDLRLL